MRRRIYTHRRLSFQRSPRDLARVSWGLVQVCNKINRGVARERTRGARVRGCSGAGGKGELVIEPLRGRFSERRRITAG